MGAGVNEVSWMFQPFLIGGAIITLINSALLAANLWQYHREQRDQWASIEKGRADIQDIHRTYETQGEVTRKVGEIWTAIRNVNDSVGELSTMASQQYARREDVKEIRDDIKELPDRILAMVKG